jgi:hypothetical protein
MLVTGVGVLLTITEDTGVAPWWLYRFKAPGPPQYSVKLPLQAMLQFDRLESGPPFV